MVHAWGVSGKILTFNSFSPERRASTSSIKHIADLSTVREYNEENDGELLEWDGDSYVVLKPGCKGPDGRDDSEVTKVVLKARI